MDSDYKSRKQVSLEQLQSLLDFLKEHPQLAIGLIRGRRGNLQTKKIWNQCANLLNDIKNGATKDGKGWSKYWCDWKYRVRRKALELKVARDNNTEPPEGVLPLNEMEENIMSIIGDRSIEGVVIKTDPLLEKEDSEEDQHVDTIETKTDRKRQHDVPSTRSSKRPHLVVEETSDVDDDAGPSSPLEEKANLNDEEEEDEIALKFLRLEERKLENSQRVADSMEGIRMQMSRIGDILLQIRDVLVNNRNI